MGPSELEILFEDNHCLAVCKPAGVLTMGDRTDDESVVERARRYLKRKHNKPGRVFLGVVHRLDRPVSGVVLFARTSKAAARLAEQFRSGRVRKTYHALVEGTGVPAQGECIDWLLKDRERNIVRRVKAGTPGARKCVLSFRRLAAHGSKTLVEIVPLTGRSHQIRVQLAALGHPIVGDRKYGSRSSSRGTIALHAASLTFEHPVLGNSVTLIAADPAAWKKL